MTDMVERVARVLSRQSALHAGYGGEKLEQRVEECWRGWESTARATIAAMREPTLDMRHAGCTDDAFMAQDDVPPLGHFSPTPVWQAMIDAILEEKKDG